MAHVGQHQVHVVARGAHAVVHGVPGRGPHERAGQGLLEVPEVGHGGGQGALVQADLGVGEVVVVEQHQVRALPAHELGDLGELAVHVQLHAERAGEPAGVLVVVVEAHGHAVGTKGGVALLADLLDREGGDHAVVVGLHAGDQGVHPGGLEPALGPVGQVPPARGLELHHEVGELGVGPRVLVEVPLEPGHELLLAHPRDQLLEHGGALGVGDAVEVHEHGLEVRDLGLDGVRGGQLVLRVAPGLLPGHERGPGVGVLRVLRARQGGHVLREGLVEPQVVPPAHGHQVPEPHVRELVEHSDGAALHESLGRLGAEDVGLHERDRTRVLHGARVELGHEELVVLLERVGGVELGLEELEALLGDLEHLLGVHVLEQGAPCVQPQLDGAAVGGDQAVVGAEVRAGDQRGHVAGHHGRGGEVPAGHALGDRHGLGAGLVGHHGPLSGGRHAELERGLEVRLLEHREHPARVRDLELRVEVHLAVGRIHEAVQALARVHVVHGGLDHQLVLRREPRELDALAVADLGGVEGRTVEGDGLHRGGDRVDERARPRLGGERHRGARAEGPGVLGEVQLHSVRLHRDDLGALGGLRSGQVGSGHDGVPLLDDKSMRTRRIQSL